MALIMNAAMVSIQVVLIGIMTNRIYNNRMVYNENNAIQKTIVGNIVVCLWFLFDAIGNLIQMYNGTYL